MKIYRLALVLLAPVHTFAQTTATATVNALAAPDWAQCSALTSDSTARLACFDRWAQDQQQRTSAPPATAVTASPVTIAATQTVEAAVAAKAVLRPCTDPKQSELSRFWELEPGSDCGAFSIRGYRPINLSWIGSDSVNTAPSSPSAAHRYLHRIPHV
jgi:phospholipase A1